jgi:hypothetical protein
VPLSNNVFSTASVTVCIFLLSSIPPKMVTASDFTDQLDGTSNLVPPKIVVSSITAVPVKSACERSSSVPPKIFTRSPPLKFFDMMIFFAPPNIDVLST